MLKTNWGYTGVTFKVMSLGLICQNIFVSYCQEPVGLMLNNQDMFSCFLKTEQ